MSGCSFELIFREVGRHNLIYPPTIGFSITSNMFLILDQLLIQLELVTLRKVTDIRKQLTLKDKTLTGWLRRRALRWTVSTIVLWNRNHRADTTEEEHVSSEHVVVV